MSKPNFLQKAAEIFGFTTERVDKMTADEKAKLEGFGQKADALETAREEAISARDAAEQKASDLEASIKAEKDARAAAEATVAEREATIAELNAKIASLPGAADTNPPKAASEDIPGKKKAERKIYSWEAPLYNR